MMRYLNETDFDSFRIAAIHKVTHGITTISEVLRVLPRSALYRRYAGKNSGKVTSLQAS